MRKARKLLALTLAVLMLGALSACSGGSVSTTTVSATTATSAASTTAAATTATAPVDPFEETISFSWLTFNCMDLNEDFLMKSKVEELFNVDITIPNHDINAQWANFQLAVAAGEMPDAVFMNSNFSTVLDWYEQDVIRAVPYELIRSAAPNYCVYLDEYPLGWEIYKSSDTETMALTGLMPGQYDSTFWGSYYRLDWLEKVGIEPNGEVKLVSDVFDFLYYTDEAFTLAQLMDILEAFKNGDPDGNGKDDTSGFAAYTGWNMHGWQNIANAFGLAGTLNIEEGGVTKEYYASNSWREFLAFAANIYAKGYVDPEWNTNDWTRWCEKYATGTYGYCATALSYGNPASPAAREAKTGNWGRGPLNSIGDTGTLIMTPPEIGYEGQQASQTYAVTPFRYQLIFGYGVEDKVVTRILQMLDYTTFCKDTWFEFAYGYEGEQWDYGDDGAGKQIVIAKADIDKASTGLNVFSPGMFCPLEEGHRGNYPTLTSTYSAALNDIMYSKSWLAFSYGPYRNDLYNETDYSSLVNKYDANIKTLREEFMAGVIAGTIDIDGKWDEYISNLNAAGYGEIEAALNQAPLYTELFPGKLSISHS